MTTPTPPPHFIGFKHPRKIPAAYCRYVGEVATSWTYAELYMLNIVWHVLGLKQPEAGRLLSWGLGPSDKVKLFKSLSGSKRFPQWITNPTQKMELDAIAAKAEEIKGMRNKIIHGLWSYEPHEKGKYQILYMRENEQKLLPKSKKIPLADLKKLACDLDALNKRLDAFRKALGAPIP